MKDDVNFLHLRSFCHGNQDQELEHIPCHVDNVTNLVRSMSSMGTFTYTSPALHRLFISESEYEFMRCDLHVHSMASGMFDLPGKTGFAGSATTTPLRCTAEGSNSACPRSEEHTSELQSRRDLVCRLLLEKKNLLQYN